MALRSEISEQRMRYFRIKATNEFGLSEALVGEQFHSVKPKKG